MSATTANLIRMANQIAANLAHEKDPAAATRDHIQAFWDPRMRAQIATAPPALLSSIAAAAIAGLREP